MATRTIEAKAIISAKDATGAEFDKVAKKMEGLTKTAKAFGNIKAPTFVGDFGAELDKMHATAREMQTIHKSWASFDKALKSNGAIKASKYFEAVDLWKSNTLGAMREMRAGMDEHEAHQRKFFQRMRNTAAGAAGLVGGAYLFERAGSGAARSAMNRSREVARYNLSGMTGDELARANAKADEIAGRNPSMSRTETLAHIRQLRSRLGNFDHAMDNVETLTNAQTVLGTLGHGGEAGAEDLEKLVLGLESQGIGSQPEKFKQYLNAFVRAKSLFPDLRGEDFRQYMKASNSSKYGLSSDYITGVAPTMMQHEGASNFGVMQASAFSALIGKRQTPAAQHMMRKFGLLDAKNNLKHEADFISDPYKWAMGNLPAALEKHGIKTDEEHRGSVVKALTQMFSNRKVGEFFASMLVNSPVIEKDRALLGKAQGTEGAETARRTDGYQAAQAINAQFKDAASAFLNIGPVVKGMNAIASTMSAGINKFDQGTTGDKTGMVLGSTLLGGGAAAAGVMAAKGAYQWFTGSAALMGSATALDASAAALTAAAAQLAGGKAIADVVGKIPGAAPAAAAGAGGLLSNVWKYGAVAAPYAMTAFGVGMAGGALYDMTHRPGYTGLDIDSPMLRAQRGGSTHDALRRAFNDDRRRMGIPEMGNDFGAPGVSDTMTYGTGVSGDRSVSVSGNVTGEGKLEVTFNAGSSLIDIVKQAQAAIKLAGELHSGNGPGSLGESAPDAAAPPRSSGAPPMPSDL